MTSLHVICGLDLSNQKFWLRLQIGDCPKKFFEDLFFWKTLAALSLASSIPVLGLERVCPRKGCPWPWPRVFFVSLALASSLVSSTPPLVYIVLCDPISSPLTRKRRWRFYFGRILARLGVDRIPSFQITVRLLPS